MEGEKVLIYVVDDSPVILQVVKNTLANKYLITTASSAERLFILLKDNIPGMILLDIDMPEMNGYDIIKILKSTPKTKNIPVIFLTGRTESDDELTGFSLGAIDYITKPIHPSLLLKRVEVHMLIEEQKKTMEQQAADLKYFNENLQKLVDKKTQNIIDLQNALLKTMAELVEYRDDITGRHIEKTQNGVRILLTEIQKCGLYREESKDWDIEMLVQCCLLHDVGKIFISDSILRKPGKLNNNEFEDMKIHTNIGKQIVEKIEFISNGNEFLKYAKVFAASHHEYWDGSGYPYGLKGTEIPLLGRVMAIADVYDALVSVRPYKSSYTHEEAVKIIIEGSGIHFDPALVDVFIRISEQFRDFPELLNSGD